MPVSAHRQSVPMVPCGVILASCVDGFNAIPKGGERNNGSEEEGQGEGEGESKVAGRVLMQ